MVPIRRPLAWPGDVKVWPQSPPWPPGVRRHSYICYVAADVRRLKPKTLEGASQYPGVRLDVSPILLQSAIGNPEVSLGRSESG